MFSVISGENQEWWELFKKASVGISSLSGKISTETTLIQSWFSLLCIFGFSELCQRKPALFSSVSEKISAETALIQRCFFCSENFQFQSCFGENQRCSALSQLCFRAEQRWFLALKISVFSAVQSWISAVQRFSGNQHRWNRPESILNQNWSALNVSETSTRDVICKKNYSFELGRASFFQSETANSFYSKINDSSRVRTTAFPSCRFGVRVKKIYDLFLSFFDTRN